MTIRVRSGKIEFRGNVDFDELYQWALNNTTYAEAVSESIVELKYPSKVKNNGVLDTSYSTLILNHRLESDWRSTGDSGVWKCHKGIVMLKGNASMFSEWWAIPEFRDVQFIVNKSGGKVSFFRSEGNSRKAVGEVRGTKYFIKKGEVDAHLQLCAGVGILKDTVISTDDAAGGVLLVRDTDTDGVAIKGLSLGGWRRPRTPVTFHKNMVLDHGTGNDRDIIPFLYRRDNHCIFYNVVNETTQTRKKMIDIRNPEAWSGRGRSIIVGKFSPTFVDSSGEPVDNLNILIRNKVTGEEEHRKVTNEEGVIDIQNNSWDDKHTSLEWQNRKFYELGTCYVKQCIVPDANGPQQSEDQGDFIVTIRKPNLVPFETTVDFHDDMGGEMVMFIDDVYMNSFSSYNEWRSVSTAQELYDHYKQFLSEFDNIDQPDILKLIGEYIVSDYSITVDRNQSNTLTIDNENKLIRFKSSVFKGNLYSKGGMVNIRNGAKVEGTVEDINGCRVRVFAKQGGRFNIVARRADDNFLLADYKNVESCDIYIPRGIDIKFAMWQLGYQVYADTIKTDNGGINYYAPMIQNKFINTRLDMRNILSGIRVGLDYPYFIMYVNKPMVLDIEEIKTLLHYIVGSSESLGTSLGTGSSVSTIEILKDEVKINLPFVLVKRGGELSPTDRVEFNGYVNTTDAKKLDRNYIINPSNEDGLFVQTLSVKPTLDPALLSQVVKDQLRPDLAAIRGQIINAVKGE